MIILVSTDLFCEFDRIALGREATVAKVSSFCPGDPSGILPVLVLTDGWAPLTKALMADIVIGRNIKKR